MRKIKEKIKKEEKRKGSRDRTQQNTAKSKKEIELSNQNEKLHYYFFSR